MAAIFNLHHAWGEECMKERTCYCQVGAKTGEKCENFELVNKVLNGFDISPFTVQVINQTGVRIVCNL